MRRGVFIALAGAGLVAAGPPNAEAFYQRATALKEMGVGAMFSPDLQPLLDEAKAAGAAAEAQRKAAMRAKKRARYCPPSADERMGAEEYYDRLSAIPAATRRRITLTEATVRVLAAKYPCR